MQSRNFSLVLVLLVTLFSAAGAQNNTSGAGHRKLSQSEVQDRLRAFRADNTQITAAVGCSILNPQDEQ